LSVDETKIINTEGRITGKSQFKCKIGY